MIAIRIAALTAITGLLGTPVAAQTFGGGVTKQQTLPAPSVVRMPLTFGGTGASSNPNDRIVLSGEYTSRVHTVGDRLTEPNRVLRERFAEEQAFIAKRGAGKPVVLRRARY